MRKKKTNRQFAAALYELTREATAKTLPEILSAFAALLAREHKLRRADGIIKEFEKYSKEQSGAREIEVESAMELSGAIKKEIGALFGGKAEITEKTDPSLLGGVRIKVGDEIFDASLRRQLQRLKLQLAS